MIFLALLLSVAFTPLVLSQNPEAIAYFSSDSQVNGSAVFTSTGFDGISVAISNVCQLDPSTEYYFRISDVGDRLSFSSGLTFSPDGSPIDCTGTKPAGDLGTLTSDSNGCLSGNLASTTASLFANNTAAIFGRFILIQESGACEDYDSAVVARGVIGYKQNSPSASGNQTVATAATVLFQPVTSSSLTGSAILQATPSGTKITLYVTGLVPGASHGIHIHEFGDLTSSASTGGHYNPFGKNHSCPGVGEAHEGDLGNFVADSNGTIFSTIEVTGLLNYGAPSSFIGRAIVVHAAPDDCTTQPTGNSGSRLLHGVIGLAKDSEISSPSGIAVISPKNAASVSGTVTFTRVHNGDRWGVNGKVKASGLTPNSFIGLQIHEYGDVENLGNTFNGSLSSCIFSGLKLMVDANGTVDVNLFSDDISLDPSSDGFIMGRGLSLGQQYEGCGDGSFLGVSVIGYQFNSITISSSGANIPANQNLQAVCHVKGTTGNDAISGKFIFTVNATQGVNVYLFLSGFPASSTRSTHIHAFGDISKGNGDNLGGHYNPTSKSHACPNSTERHVGDMGNFVTSAKGNIYTTFYNNLASLNSVSSSSILGRGIIIHGGTDDCATQPTGNSGPRIGQCVIGYTKPEVRNTPQEPTDAPTMGPTTAPTTAPTEPNGSSLLVPAVFIVALSFLFIIL